MPKLDKARGTKTRGGYLLGAYLDSRGLSYEQFGAEIGCTKSFIGQLVNSICTPGLTKAVEIEDKTGGFVPARSWVEER